MNWAGSYPRADLIKMQEEDPDIGKILAGRRESKQTPSRDKVAPKSPAVRHLWLLWDQLGLVEGVMYKQWVSTKRGVSALQLGGSPMLQAGDSEQLA